jgi:hypothetical protein
MNLKSLSISILLSIIISTSIISQPVALSNPADSVLQVVKCSNFKVTGDGSNPEWNHAKGITFDQRGSASPYLTRFKIMYSDSGIYCLYDCQDNKITATLKGDNMDIFLEDVVEAFFWADEKVPVYFEYELSPLNYELVLMVPNYDGRFLGWIPWHYSGKRLTQHAVSIQYKKEYEKDVVSWTGEFFIPYELLKPMVLSPPEKGTRWRANFYRIDYDNEPSHWSWLPVKTNFHDYQRFGTILFQ